MKVSLCATDSSTHYFIEKESLDNPGKRVRWDQSQKIWVMPSGHYTRYRLRTIAGRIEKEIR